MNSMRKLINLFEETHDEYTLRVRREMEEHRRMRELVDEYEDTTLTTAEMAAVETTMAPTKVGSK